ncbi:MAG: hypothetical protein ABI867_31260 [Kofleriaceae bacterium]
MRGLLVIVCLGVAGSAAAQPAPELPPVEPAPVVVEPAPPPPPPPRVDARDDAGWQLYHAAFAALMDHARGKARGLTAQLVHDYPGHPATLAIESAREDLGVTDKPRVEIEKPSKGARAELALFQGIHGIFLGLEVCAIAECNDGGSVLLLGLVGGAIGAGASLSVPDLTSGRRALLNSGTVWGAANAGLLLAAIQPDVDDSAAPIVGPLMAGQLGGMGVGYSLFRYQPTAGQVGLANSTGQWSAVITGLLIAGLDDDPSDSSTKGYALAVLAALDGGLGVGAYLAGKYPHVSRAQTLVIDAGGIFGAVAGGGLLVLAQDEFGPGTALGAAAGTAVGLGIAAYMTRNWNSGNDNDSSGATTYLAPAPHGSGAVAGIGWTW